MLNQGPTQPGGQRRSPRPSGRHGHALLDNFWGDEDQQFPLGIGFAVFPKQGTKERDIAQQGNLFDAVVAFFLINAAQHDGFVSGGMDSSSIVCFADSILAQGSEVAPGVDTVSYFINAEPNWDERPYFTKLEEKRCRTGCHIDLGSQDSVLPRLDSDRLVSMPSDYTRHTEAGRLLAACMVSQGNRVVLSGIGGDEVTGGVPTPIPELADLLASFRLRTLAHQLKVWALNKRRPWFHLLIETTEAFLPPIFGGSFNQPAPWLQPSFVERNRGAIAGYETRLKLFGSSPHFQFCLSTLAGLRRQLACMPIPSDPPYEKRYPYLDRDLLEFLFAVPREQLVRPGQRRSLMRRALVGIVPREILDRKRKAFVARAPLRAISGHPKLEDLCQSMITAELGLVNPQIFGETLESARNGKEVPIISLMRTLAVEVWLRNLYGRDILARRIPSTISANSLRGVRTKLQDVGGAEGIQSGRVECK